MIFAGLAHVGVHFFFCHWVHFGFWEIFSSVACRARFAGLDAFSAVILMMADVFAEQTFDLCVEFHLCGVFGLAVRTVTVVTVVTIVSFVGRVVASGEVASVSTVSPGLASVVATAGVVSTVVAVALLD